MANLAPRLAAASRFDDAEHALAEARSIEDPAWPARLRYRFAMNQTRVAQCRGDVAGMREGAFAMIAAADQLGGGPCAAIGRYYQGRAALVACEYEKGLELLQASATELRELNQPRYATWALFAICGAHLRLGNFESARIAAQDYLPGAMQLEAKWGFNHIALFCVKSGRLEEAGLLMGYLDATREARVPGPPSAPEERSGCEVSAALADLGADEHARLRAVGARMTANEVEALVRRLLAVPWRNESLEAAEAS